MKQNKLKVRKDIKGAFFKQTLDGLLVVINDDLMKVYREPLKAS